jgi:hypothetical protein
MQLFADHVKVPFNLLLFVELLDWVTALGRRYVGCVFQLKRLENNVVCGIGQKLEHLKLVF